MLVPVLLCLGQSYSIDDAGVVELVAEEGVSLGGEHFKQSSVGIEAAGVEYGGVAAVEFSDLGLELRVYVLAMRNNYPYTKHV